MTNEEIKKRKKRREIFGEDKLYRVVFVSG